MDSLQFFDVSRDEWLLIFDLIKDAEKTYVKNPTAPVYEKTILEPQLNLQLSVSIETTNQSVREIVGRQPCNLYGTYLNIDVTRRTQLSGVAAAVASGSRTDYSTSILASIGPVAEDPTSSEIVPSGGEPSHESFAAKILSCGSTTPPSLYLIDPSRTDPIDGIAIVLQRIMEKLKNLPGMEKFYLPVNRAVSSKIFFNFLSIYYWLQMICIADIS